MSDAPYDLRDYVLDELSAEQRADVERYLQSSAEAREEVERLKVTQRALLSVPDEEVPRRVAFVSDKVFEPSPAVRMWRAFWGETPRLAMGLAAVLLVLFGGLWLVEPTVTADASGWRIAFGSPAAPDARAPVVQQAGLSEAEMRQLMRQLITESEARQSEAVAELVSEESGKVTRALRTEVEASRQSAEQAYFLLKGDLDRLQRDAAEVSVASMER